MATGTSNHTVGIGVSSQPSHKVPNALLAFNYLVLSSCLVFLMHSEADFLYIPEATFLYIPEAAVVLANWNRFFYVLLAQLRLVS